MKQEELIAAKDAAVAAVLPLRSKLLASYGSVGNSTKEDHTVVTELDGWAEEEIKKTLSEFNPSIGFLGEEHGAVGNQTLRWLVDPIDGTEQYIRGIPFCANMLCLADGNDLLVSVIYNFVTDEMYWAVKGSGAWCNNQQIHVSNRPIERSFVEIRPEVTTLRGIELYVKVEERIKTITRFNCSAFVSVMIASGRIEGCISTHSKGGPWDYAPGSLLIREAGGTVEHFGGATYEFMNLDSYVAGTQAVVDMTRKLYVED